MRSEAASLPHLRNPRYDFLVEVYGCGAFRLRTRQPTGRYPMENQNDEGQKKAPFDDLQSRIERALEDLRPKVRKAWEELDSTVDSALSDLRPKVDEKMKRAQPKVDSFVSDVQPKIDSMLRKMQTKLEEVRQDLESRATRANSRGEDEPPAEGTEASTDSTTTPPPSPGAEQHPDHTDRTF